MNPFKKDFDEKRKNSIQSTVSSFAIDDEEFFSNEIFQKSQDSFFPTNTQPENTFNNTKERLQRYADYEEMIKIGYLARALNIYADSVCRKNYYDKIFTISTNNITIFNCLSKMFARLDIEKKIYNLALSLFKYGDLFIKINLNSIYDPQYIKSFTVLNCYEVEKVFEDNTETGEKKLIGYKYRNSFFLPYEIIHFKLGDDFLNYYGIGILEPSRESFKYYKLFKDFMAVYRLERGVEKTLVNIPVGNMSAAKVKEYVNLVKNAFKKREIIDSSGRLVTKLNPSNFFERYYVPIRGDGTKISVEAIPAGQSLSNIDDFKVIRDEMLAGINIPNAYLGLESGGELARTSLAQLDINFAKICERRQDDLLKGIYKLCYLELIFNKVINKNNYKNFKILMSPPSDLNEKMEIEAIKTKYELIRDIDSLNYFPKTYILRKFAKLSYAEILELQVLAKKEQMQGEGGKEEERGFGSSLGGNFGGGGEFGGGNELLGGTEELGGGNELLGNPEELNVGEEAPAPAPETAEVIPTEAYGENINFGESKDFVQQIYKTYKHILNEDFLKVLLEAKQKEDDDNNFEDNYIFDNLFEQNEFKGLMDLMSKKGVL